MPHRNREWIEDSLRDDGVAPMPFSTKEDTGAFNDALQGAFSVDVPVRTVWSSSDSVIQDSCSSSKQR